MLRRARTLPIIAVLSMFVLQGCMSVLGKKTQAISVTARPAGARVLVDGAYVGQAPVALRLAKRPPLVIRIEKEGYRPVEIRLKKRKPWPFIILSNLLWAPPILLATINPDAQSKNEEFWNGAGLVLAAAVPLAAMIVDGASSRTAQLAPRHLFVTLEKEGGRLGPVVVALEEAEFRNLTWISAILDNR